MGVSKMKVLLLDVNYKIMTSFQLLLNICSEINSERKTNTLIGPIIVSWYTPRSPNTIAEVNNVNTPFATSVILLIIYKLGICLENEMLKVH